MKQNNLMPPQLAKGVSLVLLSALLYSIMPVLIRTLGSSGIPPASQVFLRYIVAFVSASVYFIVRQSKQVTLQKRDIPLLLLATIFGYALTNLFYTYAILYTQIGNALFLFFSFAIIAPILAFIFLKEKINRYNIASLILIFIALLLLFQPNTIPTWKLGGFFAILSALGQAVYLITRKRLSAYPAHFMMLANTFVGVLTLGLLSFFMEYAFIASGAVRSISVNTWITTVLFGIDNFFAWLVMTKGFEYLKASTGSVVMLSELVFGIMLAFIIFSEIPSITTLVGGMLIVAASILVITRGK